MRAAWARAKTEEIMQQSREILKELSEAIKPLSQEDTHQMTVAETTLEWFEKLREKITKGCRHQQMSFI